MKDGASERAYRFAVQIVLLCRELQDKQEFVLSKQLLRSGTSIGANLREAEAAYSKKDFAYKLQISLKEGRESIYWLNLMKDTKLISESVHEDLLEQLNIICKLLGKSILTTKNRYGL